MPILSMFPGGGGGSGGVPLPPVTSIIVQPASKKVYLKWTDPEDLVDGDTTYAEWAGTIVVRKQGTVPPENRFDGTVVATSTTRNEYQNTWLVDESGLTNNTTYQYHIYPFSTGRVYTDDPSGIVSAKPVLTAPGGVSGVVVAAAGNGKISIKWTDPAETIVKSGDVVVSRWDNTRVFVTTGAYASSYSATNTVYRGDFTTRNSHSSTPLIIDGLANGNTYYIRIYTHNTDGGTKSVNGGTIVPDKLPISTVPSQKNPESLIYNGNNRTPEWNGYDANKLTLSVVAQKNAGTYTATFTPKEDYVWADGETDEEKSGPKTVNWTIQKAAGVLLVKPTSVTLDTGHTSATVTVTTVFDGTIAVSSSDTSIATAALSGDTVTISSVNDTSGSVTITVSASGGSNYTVPTDVEVTVTAMFKPVAYTQAQAGVTYTDGVMSLTMAELNEVAEAISNNTSITGSTSEVWVSKYDLHICIGDSIWVNYNNSSGQDSSARFYIMGFNHYTLSNISAYGSATGTARAGLLFQMAVCYDGQVTMSESMYADSSLGWNNSELRPWMNGTLLNTYHMYGYDNADFMQAIKTVRIKTATSVSNSTIIETDDKLFVPSSVEIFGTGTYAKGGTNEGTRYHYYLTNPDEAKTTAGGSYSKWWTRSPYRLVSSICRFCTVSTSGTEETQTSKAGGVYVRPCFCI